MNFLFENIEATVCGGLALLVILVGLFLIKTTGGRRIFFGGSAPTPMLDRFSRDLTRDARANKVDPVIGRQEEIKRVIQILSRRTKNNVILVGEAGTGKTALAEGLALAIVNKKVPSALQLKRVLALNLGVMLAGTKYRGEFEQRMKMITDEITFAGRNIILFIDEIHDLTEAGEATGAIGAASLLKPALARGDIQAVGACTVEDYFKYISFDTSLERRFQPLLVKEATPEETLKILQGIKSKYEEYHQVRIPDDVLNSAIDLSAKYLPDRYFPDKAIDLIDEAAAKVRLEFIGVDKKTIQEWPVLTTKEIDSVILQWGRDVSALKKKGEIMRG
jgi:ATP-dependent Clp protease ATP-binding subunit ClpC